MPEMNLGQMVHEVRLEVQGRVPVYQLNQVNGLLIEPEQILSVMESQIVAVEGAV